jgi:CheY-like chemotaxis protein
MNLITNAYQAVEDGGGNISIRLRETNLDGDHLTGRLIAPGRYAVLIVSDTGAGIDPTVMEKIFEPYFSTKAQGKGTGLGLSTAYGIAKEHNGEIAVESEVDKGTTFTVYLPLISTADASVSNEPAQSLRLGNERIFVVDDDAAIVLVAKRMLERLGYRVTSRSSSLEALEAFAAAPDAFDLVITDMAMPNMTGDQLAKAMMAIRKDIPVIICTGFSERMDPKKAAALGIKGFLMKPIVLSKMDKMVRKVLDSINNPPLDGNLQLHRADQ